MVPREPFVLSAGVFAIVQALVRRISVSKSAMVQKTLITEYLVSLRQRGCQSGNTLVSIMLITGIMQREMACTSTVHTVVDSARSH